MEVDGCYEEYGKHGTFSLKRCLNGANMKTIQTRSDAYVLLCAGDDVGKAEAHTLQRMSSRQHQG